MRTLWAPWRLSYIEGSAPNEGCIFCTEAARTDPLARRNGLVLHTDERVVTMMNRFPYANGHLLIAPRRHTADLLSLDTVESSAIDAAIKRAIAALGAEYAPHGYNVGINLGRPAGAGIADHLHWHVVPRWEGDTNFMPVIADIRVMPEHIELAYDRLLRRLAA